VSLLLAILTLLLVAAVILVVSAPLRATRRQQGREPSADAVAIPPPAAGIEFERDELEAAREAKYREIRDAEMDYRTGKLSREDYEAIDRALRAEAIEILNRLEASRA
jgi:hypothetical protein